MSGAVAEPAQEIGRVGVALVQQWLESTTYLSCSYNVYDTPRQCTLTLLDGSRKRFDLAGQFIESRQPLYVESKKYSTPGNQTMHYKHFLANVYSAVAAGLKQDPDDKAEFMWITWHPFALKGWSKLLTHSYLMTALKSHPGVLNGEPIDPDIVQMIVPRLWLVVMSDRQKELMLNRDELGLVSNALKRRGGLGG